MDTDLKQIEAAATGDRIELYTERYASGFRKISSTGNS